MCVYVQAGVCLFVQSAVFSLHYSFQSISKDMESNELYSAMQFHVMLEENLNLEFLLNLNW